MISKKRLVTGLKRLALSVTFVSVMMATYGTRRTYGGSCSGSGGTYTCTGAADNTTDVTQALTNAGTLTVTTAADFGINTTTGNALTIILSSTGTGDLTFTDNNNSAITGAVDGIYIRNNVTATGSTTITTTGTVTGETGDGIYVRNTQTTASADLTIDVATVTGAVDGIDAKNTGTGTTKITTTGTVTGGTGDGIYANNSNSSSSADLSITAATVTGGKRGIYAFNNGTGTTTITTTGTVTSSHATYGAIYIRAKTGYLTTINLNSGASVTNTGAGPAIFKGLGNSTININGNVSITGDINQGAGVSTDVININNGATLKLTKDTAVTTDSVTVAGTGTLDVGTTTVTVSSTVGFSSTSTLGVTIGDTNGKLVGTGGVTFDAGTTILPTLKGSVTSGAAVTIATSNAAPTIPTISSNASGRHSFALTVSGNDLQLTTTKLTSAQSGLTGNSAAVNDIVDIAFANDATLLDALNNVSSANLKTALDSLTPVVDGGSVAAAVSAVAGFSNTVSTRLSGLRTGISAGQGLPSGDEINPDRSFWLQGFGSYVDQDNRQGINGFTATTGGFALGHDKQIDNRLLLGLAGSFAHTDANSSLSQNRTTIDSYQATIYGAYEFGKYFLDGQAGAAYNDYEGDRFINIGAIERHANADYDGYLVFTRFELGRDMNLPNDFQFTPSLGLDWSHVGIGSYTETGASASNLKVNDQDYDILNLSLKGKLRRTWEIAAGSLTPVFRLGYNYEAIDDAIQTVASFTGGGNTFQSTGFDPANHSVLGGLGITFVSNSNFEAIVSYDIEAKEDFTSHSALIEAHWRF